MYERRILASALSAHSIRRRGLSTILGLLLALSACGSQGDQPAASDESTTATTSTVDITIPPATTTPATTDAGSAQVLPIISDDDPRYLFSLLVDAGGGVILTRLDGTDEVRLATDVGGVHKHASWSPGGDRVVFVDDVSETIWIANLDGSPTQQLPGCDQNGCDYPAFSPDGSKIAYSRVEESDSVVGPSAVGIEVIDLTTGESSKIVRLERPLLADVPRWSPDGTHLVIGVDQMDEEAVETGAAVAVVTASGGEPRFLTDFSLFGYAPDWNTATGEIVFGVAVREFAIDVQADEAWDVWGVQPDGTLLRQITHATKGERVKGAKWTPDGSAILAWSTIQGMVSIDPQTGTMTPINGLPNLITSPRLRPMP